MRAAPGALPEPQEGAKWPANQDPRCYRAQAGWWRWGGGQFRGPLPRRDSMLWGPLSEPSSRGGADPVTQGPRGLSYDPPRSLLWDPDLRISDAAVFGDGSLKR